MASFMLNGEPWHVLRVGRESPALIDRTGGRKLATTNPARRIICIADDVRMPLLGNVALHEAAHAVMWSYGLDSQLASLTRPETRVEAEEWACGFMADHASEVVSAAKAMLR